MPQLGLYGMITAMYKSIFALDLVETLSLMALVLYLTTHSQVNLAWSFMAGYSFYALFRSLKRYCAIFKNA